MTAAELAAITPEEIGRLTDAELFEKVSPLFPVVRAPYVGKRTDDDGGLMLLPNGKRTTLKQVKEQNALIAQTLRSLGIK